MFAPGVRCSVRLSDGFQSCQRMTNPIVSHDTQGSFAAVSTPIATIKYKLNTLDENYTIHTMQRVANL